MTIAKKIVARPKLHRDYTTNTGLALMPGQARDATSLRPIGLSI